MSGNSNASIEKIKLTILEIQESTSGDTSTVEVTLKKGDEAGVVPSPGGDVPVYLGKMKYDDGCDKTKLMAFKLFLVLMKALAVIPAK